MFTLAFFIIIAIGILGIFFGIKYYNTPAKQSFLLLPEEKDLKPVFAEHKVIISGYNKEPGMIRLYNVFLVAKGFMTTCKIDYDNIFKVSYTYNTVKISYKEGSKRRSLVIFSDSKEEYQKILPRNE